ncbi:chorion peroxidase-like [Anopheles nili]|uniref:chorion peroxidase-like n=1 Tax=Anopheles nili TaxID=185578 RepID=UPI00237B7E6B|nr:chorion peroxidase-like [Anopheles nili]
MTFLQLQLPMPTDASDYYRVTGQTVTYNGYNAQCGYQMKCYSDNSCPALQELPALEQEALAQATAELLRNEAASHDPNFIIKEPEFDTDFFQTKETLPSEVLGVRRTLTTQKVLKKLAQKYNCCQLKNLLDGKCYSNLTLSCCKGDATLTCDPYYPYRSYDGSCNNLQNPTWGKRGRPLKHPFAPCYCDLVSKPAVSQSGTPLPQNRKLISDLSENLRLYGPNITAEMSMMTVFFSEFGSSDIIGRATRRTQKPTSGFRGCNPDGHGRSPYMSTLSNPLLVLPNDRYFASLGVTCLNFSPQEKANDQCELKHVGERNQESSYLDLSSMYGAVPDYDVYGKLKLQQCGATNPIVTTHPFTVQFFTVAGLFAKFHNYCVDRARTCIPDTVTVQERCRALNVGLYQKIIFEQLLPLLFGDTLYNLCGLNCQYDPKTESVVSQVYKNGPGRFQHVWIPDQMKYKPQGNTQWLPFNVFFHDQERFDCSGVIGGMLETPIQIGRLVDAIVNKFYSEDGVRGTCLPCLDLARNRDSGLCPLVTYKHFVEQLIGEPSKCYRQFEELSDMFRPAMLQFLASKFESPADVDVLFGNFEKRFYPGAKLPMLVSQSTCLQFKRLKCTDRFFYSWNPYLGEGSRHLIKAMDLTGLLALFTDLVEIPKNPFLVNSPKFMSSDVRTYLKSLDYLFCHL